MSKEFYVHDEITTRILKISAPFISFLVTHIFNKAMVAVIFPSMLKYAVIKKFSKMEIRKNSKL